MNAMTTSTKKLWISDNGDVTCDDHAGAYLQSSIDAYPKRIQHRTQLGNWSLYYTNLIGGVNLVCETCTPWDSPNHPYNKNPEQFGKVGA